MLREQLLVGVGARIGAPCAAFVLLGRMMARAIFHPRRESGTTRPGASATGLQPIESGIRIPQTDRAVNSPSCRRWIAVPEYGTPGILFYRARDAYRRSGRPRVKRERWTMPRVRLSYAPPRIGPRKESCFHPWPGYGSGFRPGAREGLRRSVPPCASAHGA